MGRGASGRNPFQRRLIEELESRFGAVSTGNGMTGAAFAAELRSRLDSHLDNTPVWPNKKMWVHELKEIPRKLIERLGRRRHSVQLRQTSGEFRDWRFDLDQLRRHLVASDGNSREQWHVRLIEAGIGGVATYNVSVRAQSHFVALDFGGGFAIVDINGEGDTRRILWSQGTQHALLRAHGMRPGSVPPAIGQIQTGQQLPGPAKLCVLEPDYVAWLEDGRLHVSGTFDGQPFWSRKGIDNTSRVWGDADYLVVLARETNQAEILNAVDGSYAGRAALHQGLVWYTNAPDAYMPALHDSRSEPIRAIGTFGRSVLIWKSDRSGARLSLFDVVKQQDVWSAGFEAGSVVTRVGADEVAVVEPRGRLVIRSAGYGAERIDQSIEPLKQLRGAHVLHSPERYVLLLDSGERTPERPEILSQPAQIPVNGVAYGFQRRTGDVIWQVDIGHKSISTGHSPNLPVLVLVGRRRAAPSIFGQVRNLYPAVLLDTRNGTIVYKKKNLGPNVSNLGLVPDRDTDTVSIRFFHDGVLVTIADERPPAPKPSAPHLESPDATPESPDADD